MATYNLPITTSGDDLIDTSSALIKTFGAYKVSIISDFYRGKVAELIAHWNYVEVFSAKQKIVWPSGTMGCGASNVKNVHKTVHCKLPDGKLVSVSNNTCKQHVALCWPVRHLSPIIKLIPLLIAPPHVVNLQLLVIAVCYAPTGANIEQRNARSSVQCFIVSKWKGQRVSELSI